MQASVEPGLASDGDGPLEESGFLLRRGTSVGEYLVRRRLGSGAMATVYEVERETDGGRFALKLCNPSNEESGQDLYRFRRECRALARLQHPNLVAMHGDGVLESPSGDLARNRPYMVMELVEGVTLDKALESVARMPMPERQRRAVEIAAGICDALGYVHRQGLVHRDLKPGNVMLDQKGRVKLTDFGVAREMDGAVELTRSGALVGTLAYMAPEQAIGQKLDGRADLYSLGVMVYELLAGRRPFEAQEAIAMLYLHAQEAPAPILEIEPSIATPLAEVVMQLLEKKPEARYPTAEATKQALETALGATEQRSAAAAAGSKVARLLERARPGANGQSVPTGAAGALLRAPLVGRESARAALAALLDEARERNPRWVTVYGPPAMGTGWLMDALAAEARRRGLRVLRGRCAARGDLPYGAFSNIMDRAARELDRLARHGDREAEQLQRRVAPVLGSVFAAFQRDDSGQVSSLSDDPSAAQRRLRAAVRQVLGHVAHEAGLILIVEDRHLGDPESQSLLDNLAHSLLREGLRSGLVTTQREAPQPDAEPAAEPVPSSHAVEVGPLDAAQVGELAEGMTTRAPSEALQARLHELTAGAPELVADALRFLQRQAAQEDGADLEDEAWVLGRLPANLPALQRERLAGFSDAARRAMEVASVLARPWRFELLRDVLAIIDPDRAVSEESLLDGLNELLSDGMLHELRRDAISAVEQGDAVATSYTITDPALAEAVYAGVPPRRRIGLHGAAGEALARWSGGVNGAQVLAVGEHFDEGGRAREASAFLLAAARRWSQLGMTAQQAQRCLERVDWLLRGATDEESVRRRTEALHVAALNWLRLGELESAVESAQAYRDATLGDRSWREAGTEGARHEARWRLVDASAAQLGGGHETAVASFAVVVEAARSLGEDAEGAELEAQGLLGSANMTMRAGDFREVEALLEKVLQSRGARSSGPVRARALSGLATVQYFHGKLSRARELAMEAGRVSEQAGATDRAVSALVIAASADTLQGRFDDAIAEAKEAVELARSHDERFRFYEAVQTLCECYLDSGRVGDAEDVVSPQGRYGQRLQRVEEFPPVEYLICLARGRVARAQGDPEAAIVELEKGLATMERVQARGYRSVLLGHLARAQADAGKFEEAKETIRRAFVEARDPSGNANLFGMIEAHLAGADVGLRCGEPESAAPHAQRAFQQAAGRELWTLELRATAARLQAAKMTQHACGADAARQRGRRLLAKILDGLEPETAQCFLRRPESLPFAPEG